MSIGAVRSKSVRDVRGVMFAGCDTRGVMWLFDVDPVDLPRVSRGVYLVGRPCVVRLVLPHHRRSSPRCFDSLLTINPRDDSPGRESKHRASCSNTLELTPEPGQHVIDSTDYALGRMQK